MHRKNCFYLASVLVLLFNAFPAQAKKIETGFLDRHVSVQRVAYKYQVFVPDDWTLKKKWPVILFLHGAGERGEDGLIQTEVGIGTAVRRDRSHFPAVIVMPQCRKDVWWTDPKMEAVAMAALAQAQKEFHGDPQRTYLTGLSMGGYESWYLAGKYPGKFAAIAPICGGIFMPDQARKQPVDDTKPYDDAAKKIGRSTPVWIFHGAEDVVVPVTESQRMANAMRALGGEVRYSEYPGVNHNSWDKAYAEPEFITWLLSKTVSGTASK